MKLRLKKSEEMQPSKNASLPPFSYLDPDKKADEPCRSTIKHASLPNYVPHVLAALAVKPTRSSSRPEPQMHITIVVGAGL